MTPPRELVSQLVSRGAYAPEVFHDEHWVTVTFEALTSFVELVQRDAVSTPRATGRDYAEVCK